MRERGQIGAPADALDPSLEGAPPACLTVDPWSGSMTVRYGGHEAVVDGMLSGTSALSWTPEKSQGFWDPATKLAWDKTQEYINGFNNAMPMPYIDNGRVGEIVSAANNLRATIAQMVASFDTPRWSPTQEFAFRREMSKLGQLIACGRYAAALSQLVQRYVDQGKGEDYPFQVGGFRDLRQGVLPPAEGPEDPIVVPDPVTELPGRFTLGPQDQPSPPDISRFGLTLGGGDGGGYQTGFDPVDDGREGPYTGAHGESAEDPKPSSGGIMFLGILGVAFVGSYFLK